MSASYRTGVNVDDFFPQHTMIKKEISCVIPLALVRYSPAVVCVCETISHEKENKVMLDFYLCLFKGVVVKYNE